MFAPLRDRSYLREVAPIAHDKRSAEAGRGRRSVLMRREESLLVKVLAEIRYCDGALPFLRPATRKASDVTGNDIRLVLILSPRSDTLRCEWRARTWYGDRVVAIVSLFLRGGTEWRMPFERKEKARYGW